jgi:DNA polymerase elongation subunit (family B)
MLTEERKKYPKGTFLNDLYKLMANSLFGKTIENPENYRNHKVAIGDDDCIRLLNNERLRNFHKLDKNCETVLAELELEKVDYNKPIAIGCSILDLSKTYMQYFYYSVLKSYYGDRMRFIYTDTDSIVCWIKTNDVKQDIKNMQEWFESEQTKGMPGVMKIEKDNTVEFRAFCSKHYYYIQKIGDKYKVSEAFKGIPSHVRSSKDLTQEEIIEHLSKGQSLSSISTFEMKSIRSRNHEVIIENVKKSITDKDDKPQYIDEYHTVALGYIA